MLSDQIRFAMLLLAWQSNIYTSSNYWHNILQAAAVLNAIHFISYYIKNNNTFDKRCKTYPAWTHRTFAPNAIERKRLPSSSLARSLHFGNLSLPSYLFIHFILNIYAKSIRSHLLVFKFS